MPDLTLTEHVVVSVISASPAHGFAVAGRLAPSGDLGRAWQVPRPMVYRAIDSLSTAGLVAPTRTETAGGPQRVVYSATRRGHAAARRWLAAPVEHVRDLRSEFLLKLALIGGDAARRDPLVRAQRDRITGIVDWLEGAETGEDDFDRVLARWRLANARAAADFLDGLLG